MIITQLTYITVNSFKVAIHNQYFSFFILMHTFDLIWLKAQYVGNVLQTNKGAAYHQCDR